MGVRDDWTGTAPSNSTGTTLSSFRVEMQRLAISRRGSTMVVELVLIGVQLDRFEKTSASTTAQKHARGSRVERRD